MKYWVVADRHFGHEMMVKKGYRPALFERMILGQMRKIISDDDILIDLGDTAFYRHKEWADILNETVKCRKWLIRGNHDRKSNGWYLSNGFDCVCEEMTLNMFGENILFTHKPTKRTEGFTVNIHGHLHEGTHHPECQTDSKHVLVKMEHEYRPLLLRNIIEHRS